jgi:hypothetical protein
MISGFTAEATFGCLGVTYDRLKGWELFQVGRIANLSQTAWGDMNADFGGFLVAYEH